MGWEGGSSHAKTQALGKKRNLRYSPLMGKLLKLLFLAEIRGTLAMAVPSDVHDVLRETAPFRPPWRRGEGVIRPVQEGPWREGYPVIAEVINSYDICLDLVRRMVVDLTDEEMVSLPKGAPTHPAWIVGHLACSAERVGREIGLDSWLTEYWCKRFAPGAAPRVDRSAYPPKTELMNALDESQERVCRALWKMGPEQFGAPYGNARQRVSFPTLGHAVVYLLTIHPATHAGQLTAWRQAMGLPGIPE